MSLVGTLANYTIKINVSEMYLTSLLSETQLNSWLLDKKYDN